MHSGEGCGHFNIDLKLEREKKRKEPEIKRFEKRIMESMRTKKESRNAQVSRKLYGGGEWKKP